MICKKNVNGWIFLDKPIGMSSNFALQKIRKIFGFCKAGYLGTLDPLASGFLPIALGGATKTIRFFEKKKKEYFFSIQWGLKTNTGDCEGLIEEKKKKFPNADDIKKKLPDFIGEISQVPPNFSSIKINGVRAYQLARKNNNFRLKARSVKITKFRFEKMISKDKTLFYVECGSGTYIRSLAESLAESLGTLGTILSLRRTGFGNCNKKLISLDYLLSLVHSDELINLVKPVNFIFNGAKEIILNKEQVERIIVGKSIQMDSVFSYEENKNSNTLVFAKYANKVVAYGFFLKKIFYPKKILRVFN
jgi:tRNA pseudouridine55 synthase